MSVEMCTFSVTGIISGLISVDSCIKGISTVTIHLLGLTLTHAKYEREFFFVVESLDQFCISHLS